MSKETRGTAESIARCALPFSAFRNESEWDATLVFLTNKISDALLTERERCAKIAEAHLTEVIECEGGAECSLSIAAAIRQGSIGAK